MNTATRLHTNPCYSQMTVLKYRGGFSVWLDASILIVLDGSV